MPMRLVYWPLDVTFWLREMAGIQGSGYKSAEVGWRWRIVASRVYAYYQLQHSASICRLL